MPLTADGVGQKAVSAAVQTGDEPGDEEVDAGDDDNAEE
jgi:hypothetical protein